MKIFPLSNNKSNKDYYIQSKIFKTSNNRKYYRDLIDNPLNPYATNWPNSFLRRGFQLGLNYNTIHFGVPNLRIKQLNKKIVLPPVYKVKYNQYTDNNKDLKKNEDIVTYYNKDKTIKSLNLYLNLKVKSEAEMLKEYRKKIMNELNIDIKEEDIKESKENENQEKNINNEEEEGEEEEDDEEEEEEEDDNEEEEEDENEEEESQNKKNKNNKNDIKTGDEENNEEEDE